VPNVKLRPKSPPTRNVAKLALSLAESGRGDLNASTLLYKHLMYPQAIFALQQTVEKATKAVGLLLGFVKPTTKDLKGVGHATILGIVLRFAERIEELRAQIEAISKSPDWEAAKGEYQKLGLAEFLPDPVKLLVKLPSKETAQEQIPLVRELLRQRKSLWNVTLQLEPSNPRAAVVFKMLDEAESHWREVDKAEAFHERLVPYLGDPEELRYLLNVNYKAFSEVPPLAFITMWHEWETRYPPVEATDYWSPKSYTQHVGIVKHYPRLYKHARRLVDGALMGAQAALRR
jgi:HEPN domain-containing protein